MSIIHHLYASASSINPNSTNLNIGIILLFHSVIVTAYANLVLTLYGNQKTRCMSFGNIE